MDEVRILVVDDEPAIRRLLKTSLSAHGYKVFDCESGTDALTRVREDRPDLVVLDLGLPDLEGVEVTRQLREWTQVPVLILSVKDREPDKIEALDAGADDYLTKPFGVGELLARIRAALRRVGRATDQQPEFVNGHLKVDFVTREVTVNRQPAHLTPTEYDLLKVLIENAGKVLTHRFLLRRVWGDAYEKDVHVLRVNVSNLRKKVESDPSRPTLVVTEPGVGYRLRTL